MFHRRAHASVFRLWGVSGLAVLSGAAILMSAAAHAADIVGVAKAARPISPNMVGYNSDYYYVTDPWSSADRVRAAVKARPGMLRYPGGTSANYWDAYHSRLFRDVNTIDIADADPAAWIQTRYTINWLHDAFFWSNVTPLSDWKRLCAALQGASPGGTQTVFVANLVTPGPDFYAIKWGRAADNSPGSGDWWAMLGDRYGALAYLLGDATRNGIPVRYVELGNEYYFGAGLTRAGRPADVEPYVAGGFDAGHGDAPETVGTFPDRTPAGKDALYLYGIVANDWAAKLKHAYPGTKVCAVGSFLDKDGDAGRAARWNQEALAALDPAKVDAVSLHLYGGPQAGSLTGTEAQLGQALKSWQAFWVSGRDRSHWPAGEDLWVTEFNIHDEFGHGDKLPENKGTWGNGLGNVYCLHYWLANEPRVKIALLHELARVIVGNGPDIHAHGRAYGLFASALTGRTRARALTLSGVPGLAGSGGAIPGTVGWMFDAPDHGGRVTYAFVNFTAAHQSLSHLSRLPGAAGAHYIQAAAPLTATTDPGEITGNAGRDKILLPPYSVTVLTGPSGREGRSRTEHP